MYLKNISLYDTKNKNFLVFSTFSAIFFSAEELFYRIFFSFSNGMRFYFYFIGVKNFFYNNNEFFII